MDDFYLLPNYVLDYMDMSDCNNTINGVCQDLSLSDCVQLCRNDPEKSCYHGYHIDGHCVAIRSQPDEILNQYLRIRDKSFYPETKNSEITYFIKKDRGVFPPNDAGFIYYKDKFKLANKDKFLNIDIDTKLAYFEENEQLIRFIPTEIFRSELYNYSYVKNGDELVINIYQSATILRKKENSLLFNWILSIIDPNVPNTKITIVCPTKKPRQFLSYEDEFYFTFQGRLLYCGQDFDSDYLYVSEKSLANDLANNKLNYKFKLIPDIKVYACQNSSCKEIDLQECDIVDGQAKYKNSIVYRDKNCWNTCTRPKFSFVNQIQNIPNHKTSTIIIIILLVIVMLLPFVIYAKK